MIVIECIITLNLYKYKIETLEDISEKNGGSKKVIKLMSWLNLKLTLGGSYQPSYLSYFVNSHKCMILSLSSF